MTKRTQNDETDVLHYFRAGNDIKELNEIKNLLHAQLSSRNLCFFIGSGCSQPAVKLMSEMFEFIKANKQNNSLINDFSGETLEQYLSWLNDAMRFENAKNNHNDEKYRQAFDSAIKLIYGFMPTDYNEKKYSQVKQTYRSFYECVMRKCNNENLEPISIFTTNYDLFNEYSLEDNNIEYTTGFDQKIVRIFNPKNFHYRIVDAENRYKNQWMPVNKFVKLFKLHGSVNWKYADGKIVQNDKLSYSENIIIYPSINKHFETVQSPYSELFREFSICLQKPSTTLVVIGYGFSDDHINNLIVQNLNNRDFTLIVFGKESIIESNFYSLNKDKVNLHIIYGEIDGKWAHHLDVIVEKYLVDNMSGSTNAETGCFEHEV